MSDKNERAGQLLMLHREEPAGASSSSPGSASAGASSSSSAFRRPLPPSAFPPMTSGIAAFGETPSANAHFTSYQDQLALQEEQLAADIRQGHMPRRDKHGNYSRTAMEMACSRIVELEDEQSRLET